MYKRNSNGLQKTDSSKAVSIAAFSDSIPDLKTPLMQSNSKAAYSKLEITPSKTTRYEGPIDFENASLNTDQIDLHKKFDRFQTPSGSLRSKLHGRFARPESDTDFQSGVKSQKQPNLAREASLRRLMALSRQTCTPQDQITYGHDRFTQ